MDNASPQANDRKWREAEDRSWPKPVIACHKTFIVCVVFRIRYHAHFFSHKETSMKCLRIYSSTDGESHFDEIDLPTTKLQVHPDAVPFDVTASYPASRVRITHIPAGMREVAWHKVPEPVLTVRLNGSVEYETSDGEVRRVSAGSFVLVEDTHGKGHLSRHSPEAQTVIWISLPNGLELLPTQ
nr:hypothetical protein [Agrobacterium tumefaciens]